MGAQASDSPAALKPPGSRDSALNGQGDLIPVKNIEGELSSAIHMTKDATKEALHATMDLTKEAVSLTRDAFSLGRDRMTSAMHTRCCLCPRPSEWFSVASSFPAGFGHRAQASCHVHL